MHEPNPSNRSFTGPVSEAFVPNGMLLEYGGIDAHVLHVCDVVRLRFFRRSGEGLYIGKLGVYAMKRVFAGAHFPTSWVFEPAKRLDDRVDYCLDCSFLH